MVRLPSVVLPLALQLRGGTPLHYAAAGGHASVIRVLLDAGANADAKDSVREMWA